MSSLKGGYVVEWFERAGARFIKESYPDVYQMLLLHVGGTDMLKRYAGTDVYWQNVQTVLDCFFTASERAEMCAELIEEPLFHGDSSIKPFLDRAYAELRCQDLIRITEEIAGVRNALRSLR